MRVKKSTLLLISIIVVLLAALLTGGALWWHQQHPGPAAAPTPHKAGNYKYVSLDKVIVMLRGRAGEPVSHYLAMDLVFKTQEDQEKTVKEHLPLLRSVAVKALSAYTLDKAGLMTIDQFSVDINRAFTESYRKEQREKPFSEAMIGKLIIE